MTLGLLYLIFTLLGTVKTQEQDYVETAQLAELLRKIVLYGDFQHEKFQGRWYAIAMADERIHSGIKKTIHMHSVIYSLRDDHSFQVTTIIFRPLIKLICMQPLMDMDRRLECLHYSNTFSPTQDPTHFILETPSRHLEIQSYNMNVLSTNYDEYAVVSFAQESEDKVFIYLMLYGREKTLSSQVYKRFYLFTEYLDLTNDDIVFYEPTERCIDD